MHISMGALIRWGVQGALEALVWSTMEWVYEASNWLEEDFPRKEFKKYQKNIYVRYEYGKHKFIKNYLKKSMMKREKMFKISDWVLGGRGGSEEKNRGWDGIYRKKDIVDVENITVASDSRRT